jgi:trk system potassium uptake protein TrkA
MSIIETLAQFNVEILAVDKDENKTRAAAEYATHVVQADLSEENVLDTLGLGNFDVVILAMAGDFEATLITAMVAKEEGAGKIVAKASGNRQKKILEKSGVDEVILPEHEMGIKTARRLVGANLLEILGESDLYTITEQAPLSEWIGKTIREADIRRKKGLNVLAVYRAGKLNVTVSPDFVISRGDMLVVLGERTERNG